MIGQEDPRLPARGRPAVLPGGDPARLQSATAAATTSTRRASRSSSTRPAPRRSRAQVEEEWQRIRDGALTLPEAEIRRIEAYFAPPAFDRPARQSAVARARRADRGFARWVDAATSHTHKHARLRHRHDLAEADRRHARRRHRRADGRDRRPRRALQPSTRCASATSRTWSCRTWRSSDLRAVYAALAAHRPGDGQRRPDHRHHRLPGPRLLRARQCPLDPDRAAHLRALRRPSASRRSAS